jgi:hypothetical protein
MLRRLPAVAGMAKGLQVSEFILATFGARDDVVDIRCRYHHPCLSVDPKRIGA